MNMTYYRKIILSFPTRGNRIAKTSYKILNATSAE